MAITYTYLSHILDNETPTYGNEYSISVSLSHDIKKGAIANESHISTTTHIGTHIDLPYHFFSEGQSIESYDAPFWIFSNPLLIDLDDKEEIIGNTLIHELKKFSHLNDTDLIMVRTGIETVRGNRKFWAENPGFDPDVYYYLIKTFPKLCAFGFDSISLSSYKHPLIGRKAHQTFLNPENPLIIIEDMHLTPISTHDTLMQVIIAPTRIAKCDGLPCTIIAKIDTNTIKKY